MHKSTRAPDSVLTQLCRVDITQHMETTNTAAKCEGDGTRVVRCCDQGCAARGSLHEVRPPLPGYASPHIEHRSNLGPAPRRWTQPVAAAAAGVSAVAKGTDARPAERYFLDRDNDGHWYFVADSCRLEWEQWLGIPADDERAWSAPSFATPINGSHARLTFADPRTA